MKKSFDIANKISRICFVPRDRLIKKEEQNKLSGHFVNKFRSSFRIQIEEFDPGSD